MFSFLEVLFTQKGEGVVLGGYNYPVIWAQFVGVRTVTLYIYTSTNHYIISCSKFVISSEVVTVDISLLNPPFGPTGGNVGHPCRSYALSRIL